MKDRIILKYELLLDEPWTENLENKLIKIQFEAISFKFTINGSNRISKLKEKIGKYSFENLMVKLDAEYLEEFGSYRSKNKLMLYFKEIKRGLFIFSYGEWQPMRFKLFSEALMLTEDEL